ncbi:MAG: Cbp1 family collagen-binding glycoprotein adhesin [Bacteroidia bacterium]
MKIIKILTAAFLLGTASLNFTSCGDKQKEVNPVEDSLKNVTHELGGQLNEKEAALQEFIGAFNEIQENLNEIKSKEKIVTNASSSGDVKSKEGQIKEDIQAIYDLMNKNKSRIGALSKKLKDSNLKLQGLEKMIENLQNSLNQKDIEISDLKSKVESLNIELTNLNTNYQASEAESAQKTEELNTAYYAIGTSKELKEKNVISREGGFIGLGKTTKVKEDFNKEYFTKVNTEATSVINIGAKKAKIVTTHPKSSYKIVGTEKNVEKIEITNAKDFWSASKYLVIIIE